MEFLRIEKLTKNYDGVRALNCLSLEVGKGKVKGLIGPNGAGKSTLFHLISGMEKPDSGKVYFKGRDITSFEPYEISRLGVGRTFQTLQIWGNMTVVENILTGMHLRLRGSFLSCGLWFPWIKKQEKKALKEAKEILGTLGILGRWQWPASQLSFGSQKLLELGRTLAMRPELLLLDEPASGLTPAEAQQLAETIHRIREKGVTIFLIEHHFGMVMEVSDEIAVIHNGELIAEGSPDAIRKDPRVIKAYLEGKKADAQD